MDKSQFLPYFHPTRVVYVDDEPTFLNIVPHKVGISPYLCFSNPVELLDELSSGKLVTDLEIACWNHYTGEVGDPVTEGVMGLDKWMFHKRLFDRHRFEVISVVVIDYDTAPFTGLDLCRRLAKLPCKKLLLTRKRDEVLGISAFNEGLIDHYLSKDHPHLEQELGRAIRRLQQRYFLDVTAVMSAFLLLDDQTFWDDHGLRALLARICMDRDVVEYYAVSDPVGYLLVYREAHSDLLLVFTEPEIDAHRVAAEALGAPADIVVKMGSRSAITFIGDELGGTVLTEQQWWDASTPLYPVPGRDDLYYTLVRGPAPFSVSERSVLSYGRYLAEAC